MAKRYLSSRKQPRGAAVLALLLLVLAILVALIMGWSARRSTPPRPFVWEYTTSPYHLDSVWTSMNGPKQVLDGLDLGSDANDPLLWLTAYQATVVDEAGQKPESQEFMCHNSLFLQGSVRRYRERLGTRKYGARHLFTLAQGAERIEFPAGFALPFPRDQKFQLKSQAMNIDPMKVGKQVRYRIRAEFMGDSAYAKKPVPLFMVQAAAGIQLPAPERGPGKTIFQGHWMVPPGEHTNVSDVTAMFDLPFDTRAYYVSSHLHALADWQELRDKTTGQVVHRVEARTSADGRTLEEVKPYCSTVGLPLFKDHRYELVTHYNNTRKEPFSAMSMWFMYCEDKEFGKGLSASPPLGSETSAGAEPNDEEYCASSESAK